MRPDTRRLFALLLAASILSPSPAGALPTDDSSLASNRGIAPRASALQTASVADTFTGSASYAVPIEAPPGTGGLTPRLELRYSSHQRADSWVGFGWSLGTSSIARSLKRGTPRYESEDVFQLDGQELVPSATEPGRYHTRRESFLRIEQQSNGTWLVTSKDGTRRRYGVTANARIVAGQDAQGQDRVFQWLLAQEEDLHGNVVQYQYDRSDPGNAYPSEIRYTLRRCASPPCPPTPPDQLGPLQSLNGTATSDRVIRFLLHPAPRPDQPSGFLSGFEQRLTKRLQYVQVEAAGRLIRCYELRYAQSPDSFRTLLDEVAVHGADGCTAPTPFVTSFAYRTNAGADPPQTGWELTPWSWPSGVRFVGALNQDLGVRLGDVDGDGLPDLIKSFAWLHTVDPPNPNPTYHEDSGVYLNDGSGFALTPSATHQLPVADSETGQAAVAFTYGLQEWPGTLSFGLNPIDLTGDGRVDLAQGTRYLRQWGGHDLFTLPAWFRGTGVGFDPVSLESGDLPTTSSWGLARAGLFHQSARPAGVIGGNARFADLNGDGLPELVVRGDEYRFAGSSCTEHHRTSFYFENRGDLQFTLAPTIGPTGSGGCTEHILHHSSRYQPVCGTPGEPPLTDEICARQFLGNVSFAYSPAAEGPWSWSSHWEYDNATPLL